MPGVVRWTDDITSCCMLYTPCAQFVSQRARIFRARIWRLERGGWGSKVTQDVGSPQSSGFHAICTGLSYSCPHTAVFSVPLTIPRHKNRLEGRDWLCIVFLRYKHMYRPSPSTPYSSLTSKSASLCRSGSKCGSGTLNTTHSSYSWGAKSENRFLKRSP